MLNDVVIVGAGPVGATLALALAGGELDVVSLDARARDTLARGDRSLALSHGARLIFDRLGVWSEVAAAPGAVTAITAIDVSQRGGFGAARLDAHEHGVPALGYVVSYRALQAALDAGLGRAGVAVQHGVTVTKVDATPAYARIRGEREGASCEWTARVAAVADGGGDVVAGNHAPSPRLRTGCAGREALDGRGAPRRRLRALHARGADGAAAGRRSLRPGMDDDTGAGRGARRDAGNRVPRGAERRDSARASGGFLKSEDRRTFPLSLEFAGTVAGARTVLLGNAAQALHPVAGQGFNLGVRDAYELAQALLATPRDRLGAADSLSAVRARPPRRPLGRHCVDARFARSVRQRRRAASLAARVGAYSARRAAAAEANLHARNALRIALKRRTSASDVKQE